MKNRIFLALVLFFLSMAFCFGQAGALRDYVGLISIHYHPDVVAYMGKFKERFEKKGYTNAAKAIDNYLKGLSGTGFVYVAPDGTCYVLTNEHVIAQSETLSITFEKQDGSKTIYDRLKVLYADEEKDLAILVFDAGVKPFTRGLGFNAKTVDEGADVYAAGFPGLGNTVIWQFSRGNVSNASVRLPKSFDGDETIGPYIQHTAQIDPGNSGGPLLVTAQGVLTGYAVVGINTLSARGRQAANYAIPADQVRAFIDAALSKKPVNEKELIAKRVDDFVKGLKVNKAVYGHISKFLSNSCTASNAEYAISELLDKASRAVLDDIDRTFTYDPAAGMNAAVAWKIENSMRSKSGAIKINLDSINPNDKGGFDVIFNVNDKNVKSEWIKEYGVYRMNSYGELADGGGKNLLEEKEKKKAQDKALKTDFDFLLCGGYAYNMEYGSALNASVKYTSTTTYGLEVFYGLGESEYLKFGFNVGFIIPIRLGTFGLMPFLDVGPSYISTKESKKSYGIDLFPFCFSAKGGMMFTFAKAPGVFGRLFYEYNFSPMDFTFKNHGILGLSVGYGF
jgi:serine protease Do